MNNYLLITLGHNSSAIFVDNNTEAQHQEIIGYEQERISGIKSDSQFPIDAINEIIHNVGIDKVKGSSIRISHWFNDIDNFESIPNKYITSTDQSFLASLSRDIKYVNRDFTHHDAHAYSAYEFFKYNLKNRQASGKVHCLIVDGFGTNEEVLSLYEAEASNKLKLVHRTYGLQSSLGLFYQYATSFTGMKENQDEYKFLGYEAHIKEFCNESDISILDGYVEFLSNVFYKNIIENTKLKRKLPFSVINEHGLSNTRAIFNDYFEEIFSGQFEALNRHSYRARCIIAYVVQSVCENVLTRFIAKFNIKNLIVAGGTFYNVKLNNTLLNSIDGLFCAMPLAGDQGAAIGMYSVEAGNSYSFKFGDLCWGKRRLYNIDKIVAQKQKHLQKLRYIDEEFKACIAIEAIAKLISNGGIVNIVTRNMEFGPRALCNTSTIFLPTSDNVHCNNEMNGRNEVMPCAPVCTEENAIKLFGKFELDRVIGSDKYMICTHVYNKPYSSHYGGIMHKKPLEDEYTGRPQIVGNDKLIYDILKEVERITDYKAIVNTSFNVHGHPIAFDTMSILENYEYQCEHAECGKEPYLFIFNL